jgi:exosome complex component CSL4
MVSRVDTGFVKVLSEKFKIGDIVKARVDEIYPFGLELSTADPSLGVVKAFCAKCRQPLHLFGAMLKCLSCGATERRKISSDYVLK